MDAAELTAELATLAGAADDREQLGVRIATAIRGFGNYRWVGIYGVGPDDIAVVGWDGPGPPTHPRFPRTEGLCGAAVAAGQPVIVGDVVADPRYLTTHTTTRSEIVIPVFVDGAVVGLIDVESERPDAFGDRDKELLERCAAVIAPLWRSEEAGGAEVDAGGRNGP
jgi:L-methionine (R)-S-oxide reductase